MSTVETGHSLPICTSADPRFFPASDCSWNLEFPVRPFDPPRSASTCSSPGSFLNPVLRLSTRIIETVKINRREERNRAATGLTAFHEDETFRGRGIGSLNRSADEKIPAYA